MMKMRRGGREGIEIEKEKDANVDRPSLKFDGATALAIIVIFLFSIIVSWLQQALVVVFNIISWPWLVS